MAKKPTLHQYSDQLAFDRMMLLIATLVQHPGVGCAEFDQQREVHHDALQAVQVRLREVAAGCGVELPPGYPSNPTIRKDLETLRRYGILDQRMYRWGYYLGTGAMSREELRVALDALVSQAKYQGNPQVRQIYHTLKERLRGWDLQGQNECLYPVRLQVNRAIMYTDPEEMIGLGQNRQTLFHCLDVVEEAIRLGQPIEIYRYREPYRNQIGYLQVWPLQLLYHDIAWYLLYEECSTQHLAVERIDRFKDSCRVIDSTGRGIEAQQKSALAAHKLLDAGWGLHLGSPEEQQLERLGQLSFQKVKVRFFQPATAFILEGECRHPSQKIRPGPQEQTIRQPAYVDYIVKLPPRSFNEFMRWVYRYMDSAQVLSPPELLEKHRQAAQGLVSRYSN